MQQETKCITSPVAISHPQIIHLSQSNPMHILYLHCLFKRAVLDEDSCASNLSHVTIKQSSICFRISSSLKQHKQQNHSTTQQGKVFLIRLNHFFFWPNPNPSEATKNQLRLPLHVQRILQPNLQRYSTTRCFKNTLFSLTVSRLSYSLKFNIKSNQLLLQTQSQTYLT
jgi:hypothetical protein